MSKPELKLPLVERRFHPAAMVYMTFVRDTPELGLIPSQSGWQRFNARHGATLREAGILCRAPNGVPLADPQRFPEAAYRLLTVGTLPGTDSAPTADTTNVTA